MACANTQVPLLLFCQLKLLIIIFVFHNKINNKDEYYISYCTINNIIQLVIYILLLQILFGVTSSMLAVGISYIYFSALKCTFVQEFVKKLLKLTLAVIYLFNLNWLDIVQLKILRTIVYIQFNKNDYTCTLVIH